MRRRIVNMKQLDHERRIRTYTLHNTADQFIVQISYQFMGWIFRRAKNWQKCKYGITVAKEIIQIKSQNVCVRVGRAKNTKYVSSIMKIFTIFGVSTIYKKISSIRLILYISKYLISSTVLHVYCAFVVQ